MKIVPNSNSTDELGLTAEDEQALESVGDLRASLGIPEGQHLTSEILQAALKKRGQAATTARLAMAIRNRDHKTATRPTTEYNKNHDRLGRFASGPGGGGGTVTIRPRFAPGGEIKTMKQFKARVDAMDWYSHYSDDYGVAAAGQRDMDQVRAAAERLGKEALDYFESKKPWNPDGTPKKQYKDSPNTLVDQAMADFGPDDQAQAAKARLASPEKAAKVQLVPDAPALSTPRPINGTLRSGMDTNVVTIPYGRERALKSSKYIKKYILSGRDVTLNTAEGSGTADITNFAPGSTLVFRYKGNREVGSLKVPRQTVPWDGAAEPKGAKGPRKSADATYAEKITKMSDAQFEREHRRISNIYRTGFVSTQMMRKRRLADAERLRRQKALDAAEMASQARLDRMPKG